MKFCVVKFSNGEEHDHKTPFDGLEEDEEIIVELLTDGVLGLSRAKFVKYIDKPSTPIEDLHSVVGRWLK